MSAHTEVSTRESKTAHVLRSALVAPNLRTAPAAGLIQRAELVRSTVSSKGLRVSFLGTAPLFAHLKLAVNTQPNWALFNLSSDPVWVNGKFPIPARQRGILRSLYRSGVEFDALYAAHELPANFDAAHDRVELQTIQPPPPLPAVKISHGLGRAADAILAGYGAIVRKSIAGLAVVSAAGSVILRDPILMGAIVARGQNPEPGTQAAWFVLTAWSW